MKASEMPSVSGHCWTFLYALREMVMHVAERMNVARRPYERWAPVRLPDSVKSVLFVCKGNICRSPLAAAYFESLIRKGPVAVTVRSAGLETTPGKPAHPNAKAVALQQQLSLDKHATIHVHEDLLEESDLIIVMEIRQKDRVHRLYPKTKGKVVLLGYFDSKGPLEIADPYSGTIEDFRTCLDQVMRCCDSLATRLHLGEMIR